MLTHARLLFGLTRHPKNHFILLLERRGAIEQTVRISGFVEIDGVACAKNEDLKMAFALDFFDYFFRQGKK